MASVQCIVDWQSTTNTILERNRHMFNNSDMSDISFICDASDKTFCAHKYVLATSSAVFYAMFYGSLAEKESIVRLPDTNEESLEQFLKFLYTEDCTLTADNVFAILYLAKKYIVPSLKEKCANFLVENLNPENVLDVLDQVTRFDEEDLKRHCWKVIQSHTSKVVASDNFNNISQGTLTKLLMHDNLNVPEVELFHAVLKWIDFQCSCKNLEPTSKNRRSVIGKAIYGLRFFSMSHKKFVKHVAKSGLLTSDELVPIYEKFLVGVDSPALKWKLPNRKPANMVRVSRFSGNVDDMLNGRECYNSLTGYFVFSVDKEVLFLGVRLFAKYDDIQHLVRLEVVENTIVVSGMYVSEPDEDDISGFDVMFKKPIMVKRNDDVTIFADIRGPCKFYGTNAFSTVTNQGITVTVDCPSGPQPYFPESIMLGQQFHELILSILC
ncbi:BTB POZ domain-containing 6-like [Paramuricea clavata]|uniref:BTB POZ domain-containing 6-like n=1 Tax=Paramuricea clavata TaxID=317549 RepID=A0A6S7LF55_PARCT|nr:BTB POZ domain-containing 6-like [Paramuricea clavata]